MTLAEKIKIMIVDDCKITRIGLKCSLERFDFIEVLKTVDCAENAISLLESIMPDVILMDLSMITMNGIDATRVIKEKYPNVKIVMLTSWEDSKNASAALGAGVNAYCVKGISPESLASVINDVYRGAFWLDSKISNVILSHFPTPKENYQLSKDEQEKETTNPSITKLTNREFEVLKLLIEGKNNVEIADELFISKHTAKAHVSTILEKFNVKDRVQAVVKAIKEELVTI